jgi:flagellar M-ring protein FliF
MPFFNTLKALSPLRQLMLAASVAGVVLAMIFLVRGAMKEPMSLLYAGLEPERAGEIIAELDKQGIAYAIEQEAIFVPASVRDKIRFSLAQEGLPKQDVQGYELLDDVNGFSMTSEMYNASYWRAKEGELTRTILAIPGVASARVHIGASLRSGFARNQPGQSASVILSAAGDFSKGQAEAIQYLVALAVSGLDPDDVAVIDSRKGILAGPKAAEDAGPDESAETLSASLEAKLLRLIEARLGPGNAEVSASIEVSRERQTISAVSFDPSTKVVRTRTSNDSSQTGTSGSGALTVASSLPQTPGGASGAGTSSTKSASENIAYEINETRTQREILPGEIKRISIAVLLKEQALGIDPASPDAADATQKVIADFEALIRSGAGLSEERGDALTVELMPFTDAPAEALTPAPGLMERVVERHFWSGFQALLLGLVMLVLGFGVIRPIFAGRPSTLSPDAPGASTGGQTGAEAAHDPVQVLQDYARTHQDATAAMLQQWLQEDRKAAANE